LKLPHGWELAPSDADSIGVCGVIFKCTLILFSTLLCPRQSCCSSFLFITHKLTKTGSHGWNTRRMVLGNGSGVYTSVFGATRLKHTFCVFDTLTCSAGQFAGTTCNNFNHLIKRPLGTSSNFEYSVCVLHVPARAPHTHTIYNLPYISHAPGQQRYGCRHLDSQARSAQQACATRQRSARARPRRGQEEEIEAKCWRAQLHHYFYLSVVTRSHVPSREYCQIFVNIVRSCVHIQAKRITRPRLNVFIHKINGLRCKSCRRIKPRRTNPTSHCRTNYRCSFPSPALPSAASAPQPRGAS
jgi:hypothetical protein